MWCEEKYLESGGACVRDLMVEAVSFPPAACSSELSRLGKVFGTNHLGKIYPHVMTIKCTCSHPLS
jgi:hypothetical protein